VSKKENDHVNQRNLFKSNKKSNNKNEISAKSESERFKTNSIETSLTTTITASSSASSSTSISNDCALEDKNASNRVNYDAIVSTDIANKRRNSMTNKIEKTRSNETLEKKENLNELKICDREQDIKGVECVICMSETRDTLILPCRHLCLCKMCANNLKIQSNNCPICRIPFVALLHINLLKQNNKLLNQENSNRIQSLQVVRAIKVSKKCDEKKIASEICQIEKFQNIKQSLYEATNINEAFCNSYRSRSYLHYLNKAQTTVDNSNNLKVKNPNKKSSRNQLKQQSNETSKIILIILLI
jgi:hypothetical protein